MLLDTIDSMTKKSDMNHAEIAWKLKCMPNGILLIDLEPFGNHDEDFRCHWYQRLDKL